MVTLLMLIQLKLKGCYREIQGGQAMREILFRGFHKDKNGTEKVFCNGKWYKGEWVEGCYFVAKDKNYNIIHYISEIKGEKKR